MLVFLFSLYYKRSFVVYGEMGASPPVKGRPEVRLYRAVRARTSCMRSRAREIFSRELA